MSTNDERVAAQISEMAADAPAPVASEQEIAETALAHTGLGVTEADINGILAQLADFKRQLDAQAAATKAAAPDALTSSVAALKTYAEGHSDPAVLSLVDDAAEAAQNATTSGDTGPLSKIVAAIEKHLRKNPPPPGERFHYLNALDTAAEHLPDVIASFQPPAGSDRTPAKVVAGSVVG